MTAGKIAQFYDDPLKRSYDAASESFAYQLRSLSIDDSFNWTLKRNLRFIVRATIGMARRLGMIDPADHVVSEGWSRRFRNLANRV
jgi:hypothetical protein